MNSSLSTRAATRTEQLLHGPHANNHHRRLAASPQERSHFGASHSPSRAVPLEAPARTVRVAGAVDLGSANFHGGRSINVEEVAATSRAEPRHSRQPQLSVAR